MKWPSSGERRREVREPDLSEVKATNAELRVQIEAMRETQAEMARLLEEIRADEA